MEWGYNSDGNALVDAGFRNSSSATMVDAAVAILQKLLDDGLPNATMYTLQDIVNTTLLRAFPEYCVGNTLNSGFAQFSIRDEVAVSNRTVNKPLLFLQCGPPNVSDHFVVGNGVTLSGLLKSFPRFAANLNVSQDVPDFVQTDAFLDGMAMITFTTTAICVGTWMVYLVLLLLPANNHNKRKRLVNLYVLLSAVCETVLLCKGVDNAFTKQYNGNFQDAYLYSRGVANTDEHNALQVLLNLLCYINWFYIVYYMYHDSRRKFKRWVPPFMRTRNKVIISVSAILIVLDIIPFSLLLWEICFKTMSILYRVVDYLIYTIFSSLICIFLIHNFGFLFVPSNAYVTSSQLPDSKENTSKYKSMIFFLWKNYSDTIPLLVYNILMFILLYFCTGYLSGSWRRTTSWKYSVVRFIKLLITVNIWGLIGVLERKEKKISHETVLGRKINNKDRFFANPTISYGDEEEEEEELARDISSQPNNAPTPHDRPWYKVNLQYPITMMSKKFQTVKDRRRHHAIETSQEHSFGTSSKALFTTKSMHSNKQKNKSGIMLRTFTHNDQDRSSRNLDKADDTGSVETELTRNFIYNYEDSTDILE